jgi:NADH-quinone oxidoreductase subunit L
MLQFVVAILVVVSPAALLLVLGMTSLFRTPLREGVVANAVQLSSLLGLAASIGMLVFMLASNLHDYPVDFGDWVSLKQSNLEPHNNSSESSKTPLADGHPNHESQESHDDPSSHFHLRLKLVFDRLSIPFLIMSYILCGVIGAFALRYMHLEPGFHRFFLFYAVFQLGMVMTSLAGTIETLFIGWELVGLSSALLVAFFHDRPAPVQNGLRVWSVYRISDAAFLVAALTLHHLSGSGDFEALMGQGDWPFGVATINSHQALSVGVLLLIAAAGKSALLPFSGWLPRAMEGPTPSSAVFYGALSVHLGAFLLLRVSPILDKSPLLSAMVVILGFLTLCFAAMAARVQTDIKSALAFASLMQVSIIFMEIGLGLRYIALIHIIGHACIRTLQLVRAPSLLKDHSTLENAIGDHLPLSANIWRGLVPVSFRDRLYRFALERGRLDSILDDFIAKPITRTLMLADRAERKITAALAGKPKADAKSDKSLTEVE